MSKVLQELFRSDVKIKTKHLWHSTQVYCLTFDRTGRFVFTGGDDGIVKIYCLSKDEFVKALSDESVDSFAKEVEDICQSLDTETPETIEAKLERFAVCDLAVNHENTLIAAAKHNGSIPIWNLQTYDLVIRFEEQTFPIRSIRFTPMPFADNKKYLISTSNDGFIFCYAYDPNSLQFEPNSLHRKGKYDCERAVNLCCDSTTGGLLFGVVHTFGIRTEVSKPKSKKEESPLKSNAPQSAIRVFSLSDDLGPKEEWKAIEHKSHEECEYSLRFSHTSFRFATGCDKSSHIFIWAFDKANKKWESILVNISNSEDKKTLRGKSKKSLDSVFVDEIVFSRDDKYLITNLNDNSIKVWNSESGALVKHFSGQHSNKISVVEGHPKDDNIFVSAGYDSKIFIYDITSGSVIRHFDCSINAEDVNENGESLTSVSAMNPMILQCSFSPDGDTIAATDHFGHLTIFSFNSKKSDCLDQLEDILFKMHADSEESADSESVPHIEPTEKEINLFKAIFEVETDLLKGVEKPSPYKLNPLKDEPKSVRKLNFEDTVSPQKEGVNAVKTTTVSESKTKLVKKFKPPLKKQLNTPFKTPLKTPVKTAIKSEVTPNTSNKRTRRTPPKKVTKTETNVSNDSPPEKKSLHNKKAFKEILEQIWENPNSLPFQNIDHILYPTYRKEISDADLCLSTIKVDIAERSRYTFQRFNKDMNTIIENAKTFFRDKEEEIYEMAMSLENFYCTKMVAEFGDAFKPPISDHLSDDESDTQKEKPSTSKPIDKPIEVESTDSLTKTGDKKTLDSTRKPKVVNSVPESAEPDKSDINLKTKANGAKPKATTKRASAQKSKTVSKRTKTEKKSAETDHYIEVTDNNHNDFEEYEEIIDKTPQTSTEMETIIKINGTDSGVQSDTGSVEIQEQIPDLKNCLFCVFCDEFFGTKPEAIAHYVLHLCPLICVGCKQCFATYDQYLIHTCPHPKTSQNIEWCRQYSDSIAWIDKFLTFQTKPDIRTSDDQSVDCIVCQKVKRFRPESTEQPIPGSSQTNGYDSHLERHLKYKQQYQCLICILKDDQYFYCQNSAEAIQHMNKTHESYEYNQTNAFQYFDPSIPKLEELFHKSNHS